MVNFFHVFQILPGFRLNSFLFYTKKMYYTCNIACVPPNLDIWVTHSFSLHCQRLIGELIGYPWSGVRRLSSSLSVIRRPFTISNVFSSETTWPIEAKFNVQPAWQGGKKVYINGPGHMTKIAATPIYGKNPSKIFFSRTGGPIFTKLGM